MRSKVVAARRRRGRARARNRLHRRLIAASVSLLVFVALVGLLRSSGCRRVPESARKKGEEGARSSRTRPAIGQTPALTAIQRLSLARRLTKAAEDAGGAEVWVKSISAAQADTGSSSAVPLEALAISTTFDPVLASIKRAADMPPLRAAVHVDQNGGLRVAAIQITQGREPVENWRLREVSQLFRTAIVIDDLGQNGKATDQLVAMTYPITFSILPGLPYSKQTAEEAHHAGHEVMLHLPMEARPGAAATGGKGVIRVGMPEAEVAEILEADLTSVSYVRGVNNHQGSRATADPQLMLAVMRTLAEHHLFFVDSRTTADTVAFDEARRLGVPSFFRSVFLDDKADVSYTLGQLEKLRRVVKERGAALAIGHPHASTITALKQYLPRFEHDDIQLVPASALVRLPEVARLTPTRSSASQVASRKQE